MPKFHLTFLLVLLFGWSLTGCVSTLAWDRGFPPIDSTLSEPEKNEALGKFTLKSIRHTQVVAAVGEKEQIYARHTFLPILRQVAPDALAAIDKGDVESERANIFLPIYMQSLTFTVSEEWPRWVAAGRDVVIAGTIGASMYFSSRAEDHYREATDIYNSRLKAAWGER